MDIKNRQVGFTLPLLTHGHQHKYIKHGQIAWHYE